MVRVGMAAGVVVDIVVGSIPCAVSTPPLSPQKCHQASDEEMFITEGFLLPPDLYTTTVRGPRNPQFFKTRGPQ